MSYVKSVEAWNIGIKGKRVIMTKAVVRDEFGRFHGATNYRVNLGNVITRKVQA